MKLNHRQTSEIMNAVRAGASVHMLAQKFTLTIEQAQDYLELHAEEIKQGAPAQRVAIRQALRDQVPGALQVLIEIARNKDGVLDDDKNIAKAAMRIKAADAILKHAGKFVDEDVLRGWYEKPENSRETLTVFDYGSEIDETGAITQFARPMLKIAGDE